MQIIKSDSLTKEYIYYEKKKGVVGSLKNLFKKEYKRKTAVKEVSFDIEKGSIVGLIGFNGAGKTTTLKMLSGILKPSSGRVEVCGFDPFLKKTEFLKKITMVMGNKSQLWWDIPAIETMELNRYIFEVEKEKYNKILDELVETLNVSDLLNIQVRRLSLGERMKMELIAALIHSPEVLFLDEPTIGLDIITQHNIRKFLKEHNKKNNTTIILTSHNFDDISHLCDRILIIDKGSIIHDDIFEDFLKKYSTEKIINIKLKNGARDVIKSLNDNDIKSVKENEIKMSVKHDKVIGLMHRLTTEYMDSLRDISVENMELEQVVRDIYLQNRA